jgi:hypothetical protein
LTLDRDRVSYDKIQKIGDRAIMLLRVISILIIFSTSSIGNAATICSENRASVTLEKQEKDLTKNTNISSERKEISQIIITNDKLSLSQTLQTELAREIMKTQKCLVKLNDFLEKDVEEKIGLVYIHQGYDHWSLQFIYAGYLLDTQEKIIVTTSDIFKLKQIFANTKSLQIASKDYQTTQDMNQLGPILHESES